jgi:signal transduction histidine kinase/DNA-binding response OmpR family regulator
MPRALLSTSAAGGRLLSGRPLLESAGWALLYAVAVALGRMTRIESSGLALVWPAAAVGLLWMARAWGDPRRLVRDGVVLGVLAGAVNMASGTSVALGAAFGLANVLQAVVSALVLVRLQRRWGTEPWRLRRSADLGALVVASLVGSMAAGLVGPVALWLEQGADLVPTMGTWVLRNSAGTFVFAALAMRVADRSIAPGPRGVHGYVEMVAVGLVIAVAYVAVFGLTVNLPLAYLLLPLSMWVALRFDTTMAAGHVLLVGIAVVLLTMADRGPFAFGSPMTQVLLAQAYVTVAGLVALVLALHRDERALLISTLERASAQAAAQAAELELVSRHKSAFLATMSHEIRTPLNGVLGVTTLLLQSRLDTRQRQWAETAERSGRALLSIVNDVLDTAKIEAGAVELEDVVIDLTAVLDDALLPLRELAADKGIALTLAAAPGVELYRRGDPVRIRQVVTNLVANALKFTERGSVTVTVDQDGDQVVLTVVDTGIGMGPEQLGRLFSPYTQGDASTTRQFGGTGLGLSIARGLAERMGGTITVTSSPGWGSSFRVALPLPVGVATDAVAVAGSAVEEAAPARLTVLVAEDNEINQLIARGVLESRGFRVEVVGDGAAAVNAVRTGAYDAVFMDCQMPVMDGLEATRRIRAGEAAAGGTARIPIMAMTASAFDSDRQACREAGMDGFLPKPWTSDQLASAVTRVRRLAGGGRPAVPPAAPPAPAPTAPGPEDDLAAVRERLDELVEDLDPADADMLREKVVTAFLERAPQLLDALDAAVGDGDVEELTRLVHALRGMAGNLGARAVASRAATLEERAPDTGADVVARAVRDLRADVDHLSGRLLRSGAAAGTAVTRVG